jgi:hypothetical protein
MRYSVCCLELCRNRIRGLEQNGSIVKAIDGAARTDMAGVDNIQVQDILGTYGGTSRIQYIPCVLLAAGWVRFRCRRSGPSIHGSDHVKE